MKGQKAAKIKEYVMKGFKMAKVKDYFDEPVKDVWDIVVDNEHTKWRSNILKTEILDDGKWREYYTPKAFTDFCVTEYKQYVKYSFDMQSKWFSGTWQGYFYPTATGGTKIIFVERVHFRFPVLRWAAQCFWNLKKIQLNYLQDLHKELERRKNISEKQDSVIEQ